MFKKKTGCSRWFQHKLPTYVLRLEKCKTTRHTEVTAHVCMYVCILQCVCVCVCGRSHGRCAVSDAERKHCCTAEGRGTETQLSFSCALSLSSISVSEGRRVCVRVREEIKSQSDIDAGRHRKWRQIETYISLVLFIHLCPILSPSTPLQYLSFIPHLSSAAIRF